MNHFGVAFAPRRGKAMRDDCKYLSLIIIYGVYSYAFAFSLRVQHNVRTRYYLRKCKHTCYPKSIVYQDEINFFRYKL